VAYRWYCSRLTLDTSNPDEKISEETKDIIEKLLELNPNQRLGKAGVEEIKAHPFFKGSQVIYLQTWTGRM
jgi:serine/threonine protein kinase